MPQRLGDEESPVQRPPAARARPPPEPFRLQPMERAAESPATGVEVSTASTPNKQPEKAIAPITRKTYLQQIIVLGTLVAGLLLLIGPLWLLHQLSTEQAKLITISMLVSGFVCLLGIGTGAEPFETLASAAAYTAVLVVFLQSGNKGG